MDVSEITDGVKRTGQWKRDRNRAAFYWMLRTFCSYCQFFLRL